MTDHKFTDDELQRCIECCIKGKVWGDCKKLNCPAIRKQGCHFYLRTDDDYENTIYIEILKDTLALINRQKAELEDLREIVFMDRSEAIKNLKSEAIKEFAENVKAIFECVLYFDDDVKECILNEIDELVKEMTEENK